MFDLIAFDADDTLWHNEPLFVATQAQFRELLLPYHPGEWIDERLHATEIKNLRHFGYGIKGFVLSMIETAVELTEGRISGAEIQKIMGWGYDMIAAPVELLEGVEDTIGFLATGCRLALLTKGDLFDQESKLARSGLARYFDTIEVVADKTPATYRTVIARYNVRPGRFLMVGNSLRSDVLPVLEIGGAAIHLPYHTTWQHEHVPPEALAGLTIVELPSIREVAPWVWSRRAAPSPMSSSEPTSS